MIMGEVGRVRSFKVSPGIVLCALIFLALYFPFSVIATNRWVELRRESKAREVRLEQLESELAGSERALFKFRQHVNLLDDYIASLEGGKVRSGEAAHRGGARDAGPAGREGAEESAGPVPDLVDVEQMNIEEQGDGIKVSFNLVNIAESDEPVSGYIHILASGAEDGDTWWEACPRGDVEQGMPVDHRAGQPFIIQRFKPIQGRFSTAPPRGAPEFVRVVVYDETGRLIYDRAFDVKDGP
jgi:hypothetical protein